MRRYGQAGRGRAVAGQRGCGRVRGLRGGRVGPGGEAGDSEEKALEGQHGDGGGGDDGVSVAVAGSCLVYRPTKASASSSYTSSRAKKGAWLSRGRDPADWEMQIDARLARQPVSPSCRLPREAGL